MRLPTRSTVLSVGLFACALTSAPALAQNWSFDARRIAIGGVGSTSNVALNIVDEQRPYKAIVLPFGLFQILPNMPKLDPTKDEFDLVRAIEYTASPIHFIVGRDDTNSASTFITDLRNGELSRDLNVYRGFSPATSVAAEGLASPSWGYTFKFRKNPSGSFQGVYAGGGIYFSMNTAAAIDPALAAVFASPTPVYVPNTSFYMTNDTESQFAMAITGGYRGRFAWFGASSGGSSSAGGGNQALEGLYIGANVHYLRGFSYEHFQPAARLDTNAQGVLVVNPAMGLPVTITRTTAGGGTGIAADIGAAGIIGRWELGVGVNGIGNHMDWTGAERTSYVLDSLFAGGEFNDLPAVPVGDIRVELPVDVRGNASYDAGPWMAITEFGHGFNGGSVRLGYEQRLGRVQLRGGARYIKERWEPTGGAGYNLTNHFGVDVGLFSTSANLERQRHLAIAVSLRLMTKAGTRD
jgi:hypothetical protein